MTSQSPESPIGSNTPGYPDSGPPETGIPFKDSSSPPSEPIWTYRGYQLRASEFNTAMVHLHRAEVQRSNVWRWRLDTTTNWAVVSTGAAISFAFTQAQSIHIVIPLNILLVTMFLSIEARRYRYYELWSYRVRLMETDFFTAMLVPPFHPSPDWAETLAENLLRPQFPISTWEAVGRRLRRNYLWIYGVMGLAWLAKLWLLPEPTTTWSSFIIRASIGPVPGSWVLMVGLVFYLWLFFMSVATIGMHQASGEVLPRYGGLAESLAARIAATGKEGGVHAWFPSPSHHRQQLLVLIVTTKAKAVSDRILKDMKRGITALQGTGMYTGENRSVLMCALTVTEIPYLRSLVSAEDDKAFVVVSPAQEVFGGGFMPLREEK